MSAAATSGVEDATATAADGAPTPSSERPPPKFVVLYESSDDVMRLAPVHMPAHREHYRDYHARGLLLMVGTFGDPATQGAMCVLRSREAAEEFAAGDPFVVHGVVRRYEIRQWDELLTHL